MQNLLFFMRVAFICNVCLLLSWLSKFLPTIYPGFVSSTVIILGVGVSIFLNILVSVVYLTFILKDRTNSRHFPLWLIIVNFLFLIPQLILLLK